MKKKVVEKKMTNNEVAADIFNRSLQARVEQIAKELGINNFIFYYETPTFSSYCSNTEASVTLFGMTCVLGRMIDDGFRKSLTPQ